MFFVDINTAVTIPVNLLSLIDDTDFKSRETTVVYNQAGMDLVWNFLTTDGVLTQTAVTPTTGGGDYAWVNKGDGMYGIEMPASGGASINNNVAGVGWFSGICTGVLAWRGPEIVFRAATINNMLVDDSTLETRLAQLDVANLPTIISKIEDLMSGKMEWDTANSRFKVYDQSDVLAWYLYVKDKDGNNVVMTGTGPAQRNVKIEAV